MVKLSLSVVAMAASLASLVVAAPHCREQMTVFRSHRYLREEQVLTDSSSILVNNLEPATDVETQGTCMTGAPAEGMIMKLEDHDNQRKLSKKAGSNFVLGGGKGESYTELQLCFVVGKEQACGTKTADCLWTDKNYRIRVHSPAPGGYFKTKPDNTVEIVQNYDDAAMFVLHEHGPKTVVIQNIHDHLVLSTNGKGPVQMEPLGTKDDKTPDDQKFDVVVGAHIGRCHPLY
ncbi:MAG: hypothetical protein J3Q66DRAFT_429214 [Benniella sp.]|nr:MAG: hypothetical protein J3Q66DRAFT_429214 [Benniella sp.]